MIVTVGGTIPADDIAELKELGVAEVFTPGAPTDEIVEFIEGAVAQRAWARNDGPAEAAPSRTRIR